MTDENTFNINNNTNVSINIQSEGSKRRRNNVYSKEKGQLIRSGEVVNENFITETGKNAEVNNEYIGITKSSIVSQELKASNVIFENCSYIFIGQIKKQKEESTARNGTVAATKNTTGVTTVLQTERPEFRTPAPEVKLLSIKSTLENSSQKFELPPITDKVMAAAAALGSGCTTSLSGHLVSNAKVPDIDVIDCTMNATSSVPIKDDNNAYSDKDKINSKSEKLLLLSNGGGKNNDFDANISARSGTFGGRLQFFKNGKVILELARSKDGEKGRWISVPRKMFRAPSTTSSTITPTLVTSIAYSKNESLTSLSFSDDNSSIQSSPWQRDHCWKQLSPRCGISQAMSLYYRRPRSLAFGKIAVLLARKKRRQPYDTNFCPNGIPIFENREKHSDTNLKSIVLKTSEKLLSSNKKDIKNKNLSSIVLKSSEKLLLSKTGIKEINKSNEKESDMKNNWNIEIDPDLISEEDGCSSSSTATLTGNDFIQNRMEDGPTNSFLLSSCQNKKTVVNKDSKDAAFNVTIEDAKLIKTTENGDFVSTPTIDGCSETEQNDSAGDVSTPNSKVDKIDLKDHSFCVKVSAEQCLKSPTKRVKLNMIVQKLIDRVPERLAQLSRLSQSVGSSNIIQGPSNLNSQKVPTQNISSTTRLVEYPQQHVSPRKRILREFEKVSLEDNCNVAGGKRSRAKSNASSSSSSSYRSMNSPNNNRVGGNATSKVSASGNHTMSENNLHRPSPSTYAKSNSIPPQLTTAPTRLYSSYSINSLLGGSGCSSSIAPALATTNVGTSNRSNETTVSSMGYHPKHRQNSSQHYSDPSYLRAMLDSPKSPEQCSPTGVKSPSIPVQKIRSPSYISPLRDSQPISEISALNNKTRFGSDHSINLDSATTIHSQNQSYYLPYTSLAKYLPSISTSSNTAKTGLNNSCCPAESHSSCFHSAFNRTSSPASVTFPVNQPASTSTGNTRENSPSNSRPLTDSQRDTIPRTVPKKTASIRKQFASPTAHVNSSSVSSVDRPFEDAYSPQGRRTPVSGANICGGGPHPLQRGSAGINTVPSHLQHYYMYPPTTPNEPSSPIQQSSPLSPGITLSVGSGGTNSSASAAAQYIPSIMPPAYMNPYFALAALRQPQLWSHYSSASLPLHMSAVTTSPSLRLPPSSFHSFAYNGVNAAMAAVMQHQQQQQIFSSSALMHTHSLSRIPLVPHHTLDASSGIQNSEEIMTEQTTDLAADEIPNNATGLRSETGRSSSIKDEHNSDVPLNLSKH